MSKPYGNDVLPLFDAVAVASQILGQAKAGASGTSLADDNGAPVATPALLPSPAVPAGADPADAALLPDTLSDRGNAKLFVQFYADRYRHVPGLGWFRWDGTRWRIDEDDTVVWAAGDLAEAMATDDPRGVHAPHVVLRHRRRSLSTVGQNAMLGQAKSAPGMLLKAGALDADPYVLCTPDGIVDLRTGIIRTADPTKDFTSRSTTVGPVRQQPTPRWNRFLADTFGDDGAGLTMIGFLQLLLGYSITGDVGGQVMPFLYGSGKNGKSVLLDVVVKLLGDYADAAPPGFLMAKPFDGHPTDLAELHGRRLIVCSEVRPGDRFDEARVKLLTGGDRIKARRMRQDFFSFTPTHKLWLIGNHRPEVGTGGFAFWRRMRMLPFERVVPDEWRVDNLADVLVAEEGQGILAWLVDGARLYLSGDRDLSGPDAVRIATNAYAETEDHTGRFFEECCGLNPGHRCEQAGLYAAYRGWCQGEGAQPLSSRSFAARVRELLRMASPREMILSNSRKYYPGIGLLTEEEQA
ncbi:phage/plasmid primase, P4 family [Streptomyces microflavus]|uniref:DNA primase family protein n=1 Tax=Streptomyces microflavus TaxID=1919 RepID=UPI0033B0827F